MPGILGILSFALPLIIIVIVVSAVIAWRRREQEAELDPGIGTVRRLYFYVVSFVALMMAGNGIVQIVRTLLDGLFNNNQISSSTTPLAIGIALIVVGLPLWVFHWRIIGKYIVEMPVETRSIARKIYLYLVLAVSGILFAFSAVNVLRWMMRADDFSGYHWGAIIIWAAVWVFHWRLESAEGQSTADTLGVRRVYLYLVSLTALAMFATGMGNVVNWILLGGYDALFSDSVLTPSGAGIWRPAFVTMLSIAIVSGSIWASHWLYFARRDYGSMLRQIYLYVFAILGGMVTMLIALGIILLSLFESIVGVPFFESASVHFRHIPGAIASLGAGFGLWAYHWAAVTRESETSIEEAQGAQRAYAYILSAMGLVALVVGIGIISNTALTAISESTRSVVAGHDIWRSSLAASITLAIIGLPLWGYYWRMAQSRVDEFGYSERVSLMRRVFLVGLLGAGVLALLGSVSALLFFVLKDILDASVGLSTFRDIRPAFAIIVAAIVFLPYYWKVYQADRQEIEAEVSPETARPRKEVSVLVRPDGDVFVRRLEAALGYGVTAMRWADADSTTPSLSDEDCTQIALRVSEATGSRVMIVPGASGVQVLSYN